MTGPQVASAVLDIVQLIGLGAVLFFTWKSQQSIDRYKKAIDRYADYLDERKKLLDLQEVDLKNKEALILARQTARGQ